MLMVAIETDILRANICRFIAKWRKQGLIEVVKTDRCIKSKHKAGYLTTNPNLFNTDQLNLFSNE